MDQNLGRLFVVYDNKTLRRDLCPEWGFSCLIQLPQSSILFDTGGNSSILLRNMERMHLDPSKIDAVVISHGHGDHVGGLGGLLRYNSNVTVFIPKSFPKRFKDDVRLMGARVEEVGGAKEIAPGVYTTGVLGQGIEEQALVLDTQKGLIIITGCAHPGIVKIVEKARELFRDRVYLLLGGFHLGGLPPKKIEAITERFDELNVERISPCHCSGDTARDLFSRHYGKNYIACGVGLVLKITELAKIKEGQKQ